MPKSYKTKTNLIHLEAKQTMRSLVIIVIFLKSLQAFSSSFERGPELIMTTEEENNLKDEYLSSESTFWSSKPHKTGSLNNHIQQLDTKNLKVPVLKRKAETDRDHQVRTRSKRANKKASPTISNETTLAKTNSSLCFKAHIKSNKRGSLMKKRGYQRKNGRIECRIRKKTKHRVDTSVEDKFRVSFKDSSWFYEHLSYHDTRDDCNKHRKDMINLFESFSKNNDKPQI